MTERAAAETVKFTAGTLEARVRKMAYSLPPSDLGSTRAIQAVAAFIEDELRPSREALQAILDALRSDPHDGGPQKDVYRDDVIYRLDGQMMYRAINLARAALAKAEVPNG